DMMKHSIHKTEWQLAAMAILLLLAGPLVANDGLEFSADEFWFDTIGTQIDVVTPFEFETAELRVRKRGETEVWTETMGPGVSLGVDLAGVVQSGLTDGRYTYEIRFVTGHKASESTDPESTLAEEPVTYATSGTFNVQAGSIDDVSIPGDRKPGGSEDGDQSTIESGSGLEASGDPSPMNVTDPGDLA